MPFSYTKAMLFIYQNIKTELTIFFRSESIALQSYKYVFQVLVVTLRTSKIIKNRLADFYEGLGTYEIT